MYRLAPEKLGGYCPTIRMLEEDNVRRLLAVDRAVCRPFRQPASESILFRWCGRI